MNEIMPPEFTYFVGTAKEFQKITGVTTGLAFGSAPFSPAYWAPRAKQEAIAKAMGTNPELITYSSAATGFYASIWYLIGAFTASNAGEKVSSATAIPSFIAAAWGIRGVIEHPLRAVHSYRTERPTPGFAFLLAEHLEEKFDIGSKIVVGLESLIPKDGSSYK